MTKTASSSFREKYMLYYEKKSLKEVVKMATWELALLIFAITYLMVNTIYLVIQIKLMTKMDGVITKSFKMVEKMIDKSEKYVDEMFGEDKE